MTQEDFKFAFDDINRQRGSANRSYLSFLNRKTLHCGVYHLKAGTIDGQQPQIKLAMYQRWGEFLKELGQRIGKEPQEVKRSLKGLSFVDSI